MPRFLVLVALGAGLSGCAGPMQDLTDGGVLGLVADDAQNPPVTSNGNVAAVTPVDQNRVLSGEISGSTDYRLFDLGPAATGELWTAFARDAFSPDAYTVVLLDANYDLLMRRIVTGTAGLGLAVRGDTPHLYLGVASAAGSSGRRFDLTVARQAGVGAPPPAAQTVWLNFGSGGDVRVNRRPGVSFAAFDAADLGARYAGQTPAIKEAIVKAMRSDYARYNVTLITSDEAPQPGDPHSVVHFGGDDGGLLGLADNVDMYNEQPAQAAIVYTGSFALYETMELDANEMGLMIANVASHELGHLLGLFHTRNPTDVMDTTGSAWDLAAEQDFSRAALESSVFPTGSSNSPRLLEQTVGVRADAPADAPEGSDTAKVRRRALIRGFAQEEIRNSCGTCLHLDD